MSDTLPGESRRSLSERRAWLRARLASGRTLWAPGIYDGLSAKLAEQAGAEAAVLSGFALSAALLGEPDAELYTMTEVRDTLTNISAAVGLPLLVDGDGGYGNAVNVIRTIRAFEAAGAVSVTIEDQVSPKRCPHVSDDTDLIALDEAVGKIRAALAARRDPELVIIARTDARDPEEAIRRARAYAGAGADVIKPISGCFGDLAGLERLRDACGRPLALSILGWLEKESPDRIAGVAGIATFPLAPMLAAARALRDTYAAILDRRSSLDLPIPPIPAQEFRSVIGFDRIEGYEEMFLPKE